MVDCIDDDDDDEFFGNQEEGDDEFFGGLDKFELRSKEEEVKKLAFLQSYDQTAEARVQEGFEAGYQETFDSAFRIGRILGELAATARLQKNGKTEGKTSTSLEAGRQVRQFVTSFQERANNKVIEDGKLELETFEKQLEEK